MPRYLISFDEGSMDHIAADDLPAVSAASHDVVSDAKAAGVWIWGGGLLPQQQGSVVAEDGSVSPGPAPGTKAVVGGFCILETASHEEALTWAARIAAACRCPQDVREIGFDPDP